MTDTSTVTNAAERRAPRRSRQELENLAQEFAAQAQAQTSNRGVVVALGAIAVALAAVLVWLQWPRAEPVHERVAAESAVDASAQWRQRLEAERERQRRAQKTSDDYLARSAASDAALLADFTRGAERLAKLADAAPARSGANTVPVAAAAPKAEPAKAAELASAAAAPVPAPASRQATPQPASAPPAEPGTNAAARPVPEPSSPQVASAAPAQPEPAAATPAAVPPAGPGECRIYVSELSSSGKLTYADVTRMKGARVDGRTQHVFTPPVQVSGRTIVFDVAPNGCVEVARSTFSR